jgi:type III secretion protein V
MKQNRFRINDCILPVGLLLVVGCMIVPLPPVVIDIFLVSNLLFALLLVIGALQIKDPLRIAALPSLLLMATLVRLSLNLATTRAVLSTGHAGKAVEAFGSVVIQGNLIVGLVLFLLISLVQFIVVAKGAERVAEVSARFTLDALPGKQMSVDAEIRSGGLDPVAARKKRAEIQSESRFYGALDGAMKFVKGDSIAGLIIIAVNICGGLMVGVALQGLDVGVALHKYTVLTIGDGLLSQIPSLLNSVAAGLIVTRVQIDENSTLSSDLLGQLGEFTIARGFVAVASGVMGLLPGMPHVALLSLGALLGGSLLLGKKTKGDDNEGDVEVFEPSMSALVHLELNPDLRGELPPIKSVVEGLESFRRYSFETWGLVLDRPGVSLWRPATGHYRILVRGMEVMVSRIRREGDSIWENIERDLKRVVDAYRVELVDDATTRKALDYVERQASELVASVIPTTLTLTKCTNLLRSLLKEGITVRHLDIILQTIAEFGGRMSERNLLAEVRVALRLVISRKVGINGAIPVVTIDPVVDLALAKSEDTGTLLSAELLETFSEQLIARITNGRVVLVSKRSRGFLRDILNAKGVSATIIAHEEVAPGFLTKIEDCVELGDEDERIALMEKMVA